MGAPTYAQLQGTKGLGDLWQQFLQTMLSGQNVDGTAFSLPTSTSGTTSTVTSSPLPPSVAGNNTGTAITAASGNVAAAAATATIAANATKFNWLQGFTATASGATAGLPVNLTVTGLVTGTLTYTFTFPAGVLVGATPLVVTFPQAIPTSAINTAIVVSLPSGGTGNTNASVTAWGYQL